MSQSRRDKEFDLLQEAYEQVGKKPNVQINEGGLSTREMRRARMQRELERMRRIPNLEEPAYGEIESVDSSMVTINVFNSETDDFIGQGEAEVEDYHGGSPARMSGHPDSWEPGEGVEFNLGWLIIQKEDGVSQLKTTIEELENGDSLNDSIYDKMNEGA